MLIKETIKKPKYKILNSTDRIKIETLHNEGYKQNQIAIRLKVNKSTISRELRRGLSQTKEYIARIATFRSRKSLSSRKQGNRRLLCSSNSKLKYYIHEKLKLTWSPNQIAKTLRKEFSSDMSMQISHEAIYQYIYVLPRGGLKKLLVESLRQGHKYRRLSKKKQVEFDEQRGKISQMLSIHERPVEVETRIIPGHWESDLIIGKYKQSAVATLVERTTRYTIIVPLTNGIANPH